MVSFQDAMKQLHLSRTGLNKWIDKLGIAKVKQGRRVYIKEADLQRITEGRNVNTSSDTGVNTGDNMIGVLQQQLEEKDKQIANLQKSLDQEQQMHGYAITRIQELENQVKLLEAPKMNKLSSWWEKLKSGK